MNNIGLYASYVSGADKWDHERFDAHLLGGLLESVDAETATRLLDAAAEYVNREATP